MKIGKRAEGNLRRRTTICDDGKSDRHKTWKENGNGEREDEGIRQLMMMVERDHPRIMTKGRKYIRVMGGGGGGEEGRGRKCKISA